jgi:hypothetical protein
MKVRLRQTLRHRKDGRRRCGWGTENGNLNEQPFALWSDETDYDASDQATSGTFRFTVAKLEPGSTSWAWRRLF